jgi:Photosynthetic reaction centre cytochrome C subunit/Tetratricopeptide repeat
MNRVSRGIVGFGLLLFLVVPAVAQSQGGGSQQVPPMTNLQVFSKDTPPAQVLQTMNAFNESLGVECAYCHVQGAGGRMDWASDEKREKRVARQMVLLRDSINVMMGAIVGKPASAGPTSGDGMPGAPVRVLCRSCHRGLPIPRAITDVVGEAAANGGATAGLAKYSELRTRYYGGQEYDFGENSLLTMAQRAMNAKNPDDAIAYLQANLKYFPQSARTYQALGQARNAKGDRRGAIESLEKALELDPKSAQARNQLQQLKGQ